MLIHRIRPEPTRRLGECFLGLELWRRLELDRGFSVGAGGRRRQRRGAVVAGACAVGHQPAVHSGPRVGHRTVLVPSHGTGRSAGHRCGPQQRPAAVSLPAPPAAVQGGTRTASPAAWGELFAAQFDGLLYDLTSRYVEGAAGENPIMQRGYSRDPRPDCKQLVIALIVNPEAFRSATRSSTATAPTGPRGKPGCG